MKILFLHNKYKVSGGEDVSTKAEIALLRSEGHEVHSHIVSNKDITSKGSSIKLAFDALWSFESYNIVSRLLKDANYDIVHVQNFFPQLSPSVFKAAHDHGVKTVMSVRNYRLICPNALLYVNDSVCTECVGKSIPWNSLKYKCYKGSLLATSTVALMLGFHNLFGTWRKYIDGFIAISEFVKSQMILGGIPEDKIFVKYNFVGSPAKPSKEIGDFYLYVGRLSTEKGLSELLKAFASKELSHLPLFIAGSGPLEGEIVDQTRVSSNIKFLGKLTIEETYDLMAKAKTLVFPSLWNEPFGRTIVEAFAAGTPVVGSHFGGVSELVEDGVNGILYDGSSEDLISRILFLEGKADLGALKEGAYKSYREKFTAGKNYREVMRIYSKITETKFAVI